MHNQVIRLVFDNYQKCPVPLSHKMEPIFNGAYVLCKILKTSLLFFFFSLVSSLTSSKPCHTDLQSSVPSLPTTMPSWERKRDPSQKPTRKWSSWQQARATTVCIASYLTPLYSGSTPRIQFLLTRWERNWSSDIWDFVFKPFTDTFITRALLCLGEICCIQSALRLSF